LHVYFFSSLFVSFLSSLSLFCVFFSDCLSVLLSRALSSALCCVARKLNALKCSHFVSAIGTHLNSRRIFCLATILNWPETGAFYLISSHIFQARLGDLFIYLFAHPLAHPHTRTLANARTHTNAANTRLAIFRLSDSHGVPRSVTKRYASNSSNFFFETTRLTTCMYLVGPVSVALFLGIF